ncbi:MAG: hypothetical protein EA392_13955 [Cryomorphaceae bacterium]|nr:MAG: hypothetical protein EA392_13955 [Cryomorphaceae bacterium]
MSSTKIDPGKMRLITVQMLQGGLTTTPEFQQNNQPGEFFVDIQVGYAPFLNIAENGIAIRMVLHLNGIRNDKGKKEPVGIRAEYVYHFYFQVDNLSQFISEKDAVSAALTTTLVSMSYSTLRGIVLERTTGTLLGGVILPVINPAAFVKENLISSDASKTVDNK